MPSDVGASKGERKKKLLINNAKERGVSQSMFYSILSKNLRRINIMREFSVSEGMAILSLFAITTAVAIVYLFVLHPEEQAPTLEATPIETAEEITEVEEEPEIIEEIEEKAPIMSDEDIIAMVVMSEAGNQDMLGKCAVASVVLNRCDYFGLTVESVVKAKGQFSFPYYGTVSEDCYRAVEIAEQSRDLFPATMLYFRNTKYHDFGIPYEKIGDHYFSLIESED